MTVGLTGAVGDAITTACDSTVRMTQTDDNRLKGALAGQAAYNAYKGVSAWNGYNEALVNQAGAQADMALGAEDALTKATADGPSAASGLKVSVSVGGSSSKSERETSNNWATGSTLDAGRDISIIARGGDGVAGNLAIIGSDITAGRDVTLAAKDNILIAAAEQNSKVDGKNSSSGGSIGMSFGVGQGSAGWTVDVAANMGKGKESGSGTTWKESHVTAGDTLTIVSGGDTTIRGGQVSGNTVLADIGGDLTIQSLQDTDKYKSTQTSGGVQASVGLGGGSGSASFNQDKIKSDYASVTEQSGIYAGSGGFDIYVGGHTQLDGAVIASTADEALNRLDTGTLGWSDIENHAEYSGSSLGGSISVSGNKDGVLSGGLPSPGIGVGAHGDASGTTQSGVSAGTITIRDTEHQTQDLASLNRDTSDTLGSIDPIFDKQKVMDQMEAARIFGQVANQIAGDLGKELKWASDGPEKMAIHGLIGALQASIGGGDILAGGLAGMGSEFLASQIEAYLKANTDLTPAQRDAIKQWAGAVGGTLVGTAVAGNSSGAQTGAGTATDSIKYNYLFHAEAERLTELQKEKNACIQNQNCSAEQMAALTETIALIELTDRERNALLDQACMSPSSPACKTMLLSVQMALNSYGTDTSKWQPNSRIGEEYQEALASVEKYAARVNNPNLFNAGAGVMQSVSEMTIALPMLGYLSAQALAGDQEARNSLSQIATSLGVGIDALIADPFGTVWDSIDKRLAEAKAMEATDPDKADQMRYKLLTDSAATAAALKALTGAVARGIDGVAVKIASNSAKAAEEAGLAAIKLDKLSKPLPDDILFGNGHIGTPKLDTRVITSKSGITITATEGKTTTILGNFEKDMNGIINQDLKYAKTSYFGAQEGGYNVLNVPNNIYKTSDQFWTQINKPFLDAAIKRGDDIVLATKPEQNVLFRLDGTLTDFGREVEYLTSRGYIYDPVASKMIRGN